MNCTVTDVTEYNNESIPLNKNSKPKKSLKIQKHHVEIFLVLEQIDMDN